MAPPVQDKKQVVERLCGAHRDIVALGVIGIGLFGSFAAGKQNATSDVDLLVDGAPRSSGGDTPRGRQLGQRRQLTPGRPDLHHPRDHPGGDYPPVDRRRARPAIRLARATLRATLLRARSPPPWRPGRIRAPRPASRPSSVPGAPHPASSTIPAYPAPSPTPAGG